MDLVIRTGFEPITYAICFDPQKIAKGKKLAEFHVRRVEEVAGYGSGRLIKSSVIRTTNIKENPYKVSLEIDSERHVTHASCSCISGISEKCKHIYALIHYVNVDRSLSKTSLEQEWGKPSDAQLGKDIYAKPLIITDAFKKKAYHVEDLLKDIEPYNLTFFDVKDIKCSLHDILKIESASESCIVVRWILNHLLLLVVTKSEILCTEACALNLINLSSSNSFYFSEIHLTEELAIFFKNEIWKSDSEIVEICVNTVKQSECEEWFKIRKLRISASSKAHKIKIRSSKKEHELVDEFLKPQSSKIIKSLEYGTNNEGKAICEYIEKYKKNVKFVGAFIVPDQPWLCVSPDGLVVEEHSINKVLEVKCPFSCNNKPIFDKEANKFNVSYIDSETKELRQSHMYYTQCQVLMYALGLNECDFYMWSPKGSFLVNVHRDEAFLRDVIVKLEQFFYKFYLPALQQGNKQKDNEQENQIEIEE